MILSYTIESSFILPFLSSLRIIILIIISFSGWFYVCCLGNGGWGECLFIYYTRLHVLKLNFKSRFQYFTVNFTSLHFINSINRWVTMQILSACVLKIGRWYKVKFITSVLKWLLVSLFLFFCYCHWRHQ